MYSPSVASRLVFAAFAGLFVAGSAMAQPQADGLFATVPNPITEGSVNQIRAYVEKERTSPGRNVRTVIFDFNPDGKQAATENYGECLNLADYIKTLAQNGVNTVAWVHGKVSRHTVLPVLACDDLTMESGSTIGEVWSADRPVTQNQTLNYLTLAGIVRAGAVLKMIDRDVKLVQAVYKGANIFVDLRKVDAKEKGYEEVIVTDRTAKRGPGIETYTIADAFKYLQCKFQADTRAELRERYQLSDLADKADPLGGSQPKGCRILIEGVIDVPLRERVNRQIETAKARRENTFFFVLECGGGDPQVAYDIANKLLELSRDPAYKARTIAFIPGKAPDLAIFLAFACQDVFMFKGGDPTQEASVGEFDNYLGGPAGQRGPNVDALRKTLSDVAEKSQKGIPPILIEGLFDKNLVIVRARDPKSGDSRLINEAELKPLGWQRQGTIKPKGVLLRLNASTASELRLVQTTDNKDITEVYAKYGLDNVRSSEPSWLDNFAAFLRRPGVSILLVIVGIAGLVLELKAPGLVVPGVIAAVCFILFFWAQTQLGGQLIYLAIMLFLLGLALLGIEIFLIPGFGITGVCGILLVLAGLVLAGLEKAPESTSDWVDLVSLFLKYGLTMAGAGVLAFILSRYLPKIPYANRLMLVPPEDKQDLEDESSPLPGVDAAVSLLGQVGTATSMLRPAGMAKFGDRYIDVVTEGDFIEPGAPIQVIEVEGTRIVVKRV